MLELLETLLDLMQQHRPREALDSEQVLQLRVLAHAAMGVYTATLSPSDKALLRCLLLIDKLLTQGQEAAGKPYKGSQGFLEQTRSVSVNAAWESNAVSSTGWACKCLWSIFSVKFSVLAL